MPYTMSDLQTMLGPPSDFVPGRGDKEVLQEWAIAAGHPPVEVYAMTLVALTNLYHESDKPVPPPDAVQIASDMLAHLLAAMRDRGIDPEPLRAIVRAEIAAQEPRHVLVQRPEASVLLDGPLHYSTPQVIRIVGLGHPVMLVGPAGCGKTTIGEHVARALELPFYITNTVTDAHELTGFKDGMGIYHGTPFRTAFEHGGVWIADEVDAWDAAALLVANSALANGFAAFPDVVQPVRRHANFRMVATANTFGTGADRVYVGRNELDAASLDRFATINVDYDLTLERMFSAGNDRWLEHVWAIRKAVEKHKIRHVVSSRCIGMGAAALAIGEPWPAVEDIYLYKGMSATDRRKVTDDDT